MSTRSSRAKKRQSRLNFSSAPPSSPKATELPEAVRHRAAAVTYGSSPLKRKLAVIDNDEEQSNSGSVAATLPTPSSQSTRPSKRSRRSQAKIDFANHIGTKLTRSSSPLDTPMMRKTSETKAVKRAKPASGVFGKKPVIELSSSSEGEPETVSPRTTTPKKWKKPATRGSSRKAAIEVEEEDDEDEIEVRAPRSVRRMTRPKYDERSEQSDEQEAEDDQEKGYSDLCEPETSGDEAMRSSPTHKPRRKASRKADAGFIDDDKVSGVAEISPAPKPRRKKKKKHSPVVEEQLEEEEIAETGEGQDEDDDDDVIISSQRKRFLKRPRRKRETEEQEDLDEDLDFLQSSPPPTSAGRLRSTGPVKLNARQKALEALKRRRQGGNNAPIVEESDEEDADEDEVTSDIDPQDSIVEQEEPENYDDDVEDFIVEDEEGTIGVPVHMPLMFSAQARAKPKELFKYVVEWMVHKRINPGFEMNDEIYRLAFNRLDDEVQGLAGSKYKSSIWTRDFTMALNARPKIDISDLGGAGSMSLFSDIGCEACNRSSHHASFVIRFAGKPYHVNTLENVAEDPDSDDSDPEEKNDMNRDRVGNKIPDENRAWNVGQFCKANAETAHTLEHWRYHLNEWIVDWLDAEGYLTNEEVLKRDRWSMSKKRKYANRIVDAMEEATPNEIEHLYHDFRTQVDNAREKNTGYAAGRRR